MEEYQNSNLNESFEYYGRVEPQKIISLNKFIFLSIVSFGIYEFWWMYKAWRFFKQKNELDIYPAIRAVLSIFFLYFLYERVLDYSKDEGYSGNYSPGILFIGFITTNILSRLPYPFWLAWYLSFLFVIPPFLALNYAKQNSNEFFVEIQKGFSNGQIILIAVCSIIWMSGFYEYFLK